MPWRIIAFIFVLVLVVVFASFNLENRCNVSVIFHTFENVPIFLSAFAAFLAGALVMLPFTFGPSRRRLERRKQRVPQGGPEAGRAPQVTEDIAVLGEPEQLPPEEPQGDQQVAEPAPAGRRRRGAKKRG